MNNAKKKPYNPSHRLIEPLPRTRNLFLQPLFVFIPDLNRMDGKICWDAGDNGDSDDRTIDDDASDDDA